MTSATATKLAPNPFADTSVDGLIDCFPDFMSSYCSTVAPMEFDGAVEVFNKILHASYTVFDSDPKKAEEKRKEAIKKVIRKYIGDRLSVRFPRLSPDILTLTRYLKVDFTTPKAKPKLVAEQRVRPGEMVEKRGKEDVSEWFVTPLVLQYSKSNTSSDLRQTIRQFNHPSSRATSSTQWSIYATFPGELHSKHRETALEGYAIILEAAAQMFRSPAASFMTSDRWHGSDDYTKPEIDALWIPSFKALTLEKTPPPPQDPALILKYQDQMYLVGTWDSPGEEALDALLEEFMGV